MGHKILVVDDEEDMLSVLCAQLRNHNFAVIPAASGSEALAKATAEKPNVIIMDIMMPELDGNQVAERLKAEPSVADVPIIFLSALQEKNEASEDGTSIVFAKPYNIEELVGKIKELID